jgi:hypothetical protein
MTGDDLSGALNAFAELVARHVVRELRAGANEMVAQAGSPLGPRRHAAAVRRRVANGEGGAVVAGRRLLLTKEVLADELAMLYTKIRCQPKPALSVATATDYAAKYGFERVG